MTIATPAKPFPTYKWHWAAVTPTEGLNEPPVFLGVLRVLRSHEGAQFSDLSVKQALADVERGTRTKVTLARSSDRNLIRNSGQYWKAVDLLKDSRGEIALTSFGRKVADGAVTPTEFASTVVKTLELPNVRIQDDVPLWRVADLRFRPLELILDILAEEDKSYGKEHAYITPSELQKIIIPLAGARSSVPQHAAAIMSFRKGTLDISGWPDCAPMSNDRRMAREFLLFLAHYGFCRASAGPPVSNARYYLSGLQGVEVAVLRDVRADSSSLLSLKNLQKSELPAIVERRRILAEIFARPQQAAFRRSVLRAYGHKCIVTGVKLPEVLEAAHVIPLRWHGDDTTGNGLCMRSDIHLLFDSGHLRIDPGGHVHLSDKASATANYAHLPRSIALPSVLSSANLAWRWSYC